MPKQFISWAAITLSLMVSPISIPVCAEWPARVFAPYMYLGSGDDFKLTDCDDACSKTLPTKHLGSARCTSGRSTMTRPDPVETEPLSVPALPAAATPPAEPAPPIAQPQLPPIHVNPGPSPTSSNLLPHYQLRRSRHVLSGGVLPEECSSYGA